MCAFDVLPYRKGCPKTTACPWKSVPAGESSPEQQQRQQVGLWMGKGLDECLRFTDFVLGVG